MAATAPPPPPPTSPAPSPPILLRNATLGQLFSAIEERLEDAIDATPTVAFEEGHEFVQQVDTSRIQHMMSMFSLMKQTYSTPATVLSFVPGTTDVAMRNGLEEILKTWTAQAKADTIKRIVKNAKQNPPKCPLDVATIAGSQFPEKAKELFETNIRFIEWATPTHRAEQPWESYWKEMSYPKYARRAAHVYGELRQLWNQKAADDRTFTSNFKEVTYTDFNFYTLGPGAKTIYLVKPQKGGSTATDTVTLLAESSAIVRFIRERKAILESPDAPATSVRAANAIYCAMMPALDAPHIVSNQFYIGKATNGTFDRWCLASDCHLQGVNEVLADLKQGGRDIRPHHQLVDMMVAWHWLKDGNLNAIHIVTIEHPVGGLEVREREIYTSKQFCSTNQRFGMNFQSAK